MIADPQEHRGFQDVASKHSACLQRHVWLNDSVEQPINSPAHQLACIVVGLLILVTTPLVNRMRICCRCKGQQSAEKQLSIRCLPQTLALHLKRFEHTSLQVCFTPLVPMTFPHSVLLQLSETQDMADPSWISLAGLGHRQILSMVQSMHELTGWHDRHWVASWRRPCCTRPCWTCGLSRQPQPRACGTSCSTRACSPPSCTSCTPSSCTAATCRLDPCPMCAHGPHTRSGNTQLPCDTPC